MPRIPGSRVVNYIAPLAIAIAAICAANGPLVYLLAGYKELTFDKRWTLAALSPNQFLFLASFFPCAAIVTALALAKVALWVLVATTGFGLVFGICIAFVDDRLTFRGLYAFKPRGGVEAARHSPTVCGGA